MVYKKIIMRNLKDIIYERLVLSKNKSNDIPWEEFCEALANYLPRKNAKSNTIFVKNTGITEDIYINSDFRSNKNGEAKDKLICITAIKRPVSGDIRLSVGAVADRHTKFNNDEANCYIFIETFDEFKEMFKDNYDYVMIEFYKTAMKKQR
jgi:hypothetical protein